MDDESVPLGSEIGQDEPCGHTDIMVFGPELNDEHTDELLCSNSEGSNRHECNRSTRCSRSDGRQRRDENRLNEDDDEILTVGPFDDSK